MKIHVGRIAAVATGLAGVAGANAVAQMGKQIEVNNKEQKIARDLGVTVLEVGVVAPSIALAAELWEHDKTVKVKPGKKVKKAAKKLIKGTEKFFQGVEEIFDEAMAELEQEQEEAAAEGKSESVAHANEIADIIGKAAEECKNQVNLSELDDSKEESKFEAMNAPVDEEPAKEDAEEVTEEVAQPVDEEVKKEEDSEEVKKVDDLA